MSNIKDKLVEIAQKGIDDNATIDYEETVTLERSDFDNACEEIADEIIEKLPELLEDSGWVKLPFSLGEEVYCIENDNLQDLRKTADEQPKPFFKISKGIVCNYVLNVINDKIYINVERGMSTCSFSIDTKMIFRTQAEAEAKLAELKGAGK